MVAKELVDYASQNFNRGYSVEEVKAAMMASGWDESEAAEAIDAVKGIRVPTKPGMAVQQAAKPVVPAGQKKPSKLPWILLILVFLVVAAGAAAIYLKLVDVSSIPVLKDIISTPTPPPLQEVATV